MYGTQNSYHIPPCNGVYLLHGTVPKHEENRSPCQHYIGYSSNLRRRFLTHKRGDGTPFTRILASRGSILCARIWPGANYRFEHRIRNNRWGRRLCPICSPEEWFKRAMTLKPEECTDLLPFPADLRQRWPVPFIFEQKFKRFWPMQPIEQCPTSSLTVLMKLEETILV